MNIQVEASCQKWTIWKFLSLSPTFVGMKRLRERKGLFSDEVWRLFFLLFWGAGGREGGLVLRVVLKSPEKFKVSERRGWICQKRRV